MIKETITLDEFIESLNQIRESDPEAINRLFGMKTTCNQKMADHPSVQVWDDDGVFAVRLLGLLNGIFGTFPDGKRKGWGPITIVVDDKDNKKILKFGRTKNETVS